FVKADLDADADVWKLTDGGRGGVRVGKTQVFQFSRIVQHAMLRQGDEGNHARLRRLVNEFLKAFEVDRSRRAGIDRRGHAGAHAERIQIAAVGVYAPKTVNVKIDQ